jgi:hypothetical protein
MHKDLPPTLLERPISVMVTYGMLIGFFAGIVTAGVWSFFSTVNDRSRYEPPAALRSQ